MHREYLQYQMKNMEIIKHLQTYQNGIAQVVQYHFIHMADSMVPMLYLDSMVPMQYSDSMVPI